MQPLEKMGTLLLKEKMIFKCIQEPSFRIDDHR